MKRSRISPMSKKRRSQLKARSEARAYCYEQDMGQCRCCRRGLALKDAAEWFNLAQAHEEPPRSQGGDFTDPACILTLCPECHEKRTRHLIAITILDAAAGTRGRVQFHDREGVLIDET